MNCKTYILTHVRNVWSNRKLRRKSSMIHNELCHSDENRYGIFSCNRHRPITSINAPLDDVSLYGDCIGATPGTNTALSPIE